MSKTFRPVIAALMSRWYAPDLYDELQFFSMVTAAEAFERLRLQKPLEVSFCGPDRTSRRHYGFGAPLR